MLLALICFQRKLDFPLKFRAHVVQNHIHEPMLDSAFQFSYSEYNVDIIRSTISDLISLLHNRHYRNIWCIEPINHLNLTIHHCYLIALCN